MHKKQIPDDWEEITERICAMIDRSGKTKKRIANEIMVNPTVLSRYYLGQAHPSLITIRKLCKALGCTYEDILGKL